MASVASNSAKNKAIILILAKVIGKADGNPMGWDGMGKRCDPSGMLGLGWDGMDGIFQIFTVYIYQMLLIIIKMSLLVQVEFSF